MKNKFSKSWIASKQPRKQRKFLANAPLHMRKKFVSVSLSEDLRKKQETRNVPVKKGDTVRILRGKFSKKQGKVLEVKLKTSKITVEGIQTKKQDGSKVNVRLQPSNLRIIELNLGDKKRFKGKVKSEKVEEKSKEKPNIPKSTSEVNDLKVTSKENTKK